MIHTDLGSPPPPSLRDAAKALASHLRQNSAMLTMQALNAIMAVEAAVEREKALPDVVEDLRQRERSTYEEAEAKLMRAEKAFAEALAAMTAERDKWREEANFAGTLRNQLQLAVERSERLSEQIKGCEYDLGLVSKQRARAEKAEAEVSSAAVKFLAMHQRADKAEAELSRAQQATNDLHRTLEDAGVPGVKLPMTQMSLAERIGWLIGEWKKHTAAEKRYGAQLQALREELWDCQTPDFPPFTPAADHLHYAYMPGEWSSQADEWFVYDRLMRNEHPTHLVRVRWRHGPGIPNSDPSVPHAAKGYAGVIERLRTAEMELARLRADAFADDCKALLDGKDAKVVTLNGTCSFRFADPKAPKREPVPVTRPPCTNPSDLLELAWGLLANVSGGDWYAQDPKWHGAVIAWRDDWHRWLESSRITRRGGLVDSAMEKVLASWRERGKCDPKFATEVLGRFVEPKVGIVRDPVTGWTFDKFRRELEAARTTAKGNAGLFADAMNQLAAAKGGA